uniref:Uncharacterized protein n=1 Tax=Mus musculus TaxID=10090 RepID=Q3TPN8_MOUSE|nr:unnamed protein product [Mus musculus]BAE37697.1 unnamed protein product [Mus musculus]
MFNICLLKCRNSLNVSLSIFLFLFFKCYPGKYFHIVLRGLPQCIFISLEQKGSENWFSVALNE